MDREDRWIHNPASRNARTLPFPFPLLHEPSRRFLAQQNQPPKHSPSPRQPKPSPDKNITRGLSSRGTNALARRTLMRWPLAPLPLDLLPCPPVPMTTTQASATQRLHATRAHTHDTHTHIHIHTVPPLLRPNPANSQPACPLSVFTPCRRDQPSENI